MGDMPTSWKYGFAPSVVQAGVASHVDSSGFNRLTILTILFLNAPLGCGVGLGHDGQLIVVGEPLHAGWVLSNGFCHSENTVGWTREKSVSFSFLNSKFKIRIVCSVPSTRPRNNIVALIPLFLAHTSG